MPKLQMRKETETETDRQKAFENSGVLFRNNRKREGKKDADANGSVTGLKCPGCGKKYDFWLNAWSKSGPRGKFLSLSLRPKEVVKGGKVKAASGSLL